MTTMSARCQRAAAALDARVVSASKGPSRNNCTILDADASRLHPNAAAALGTPGLAALLVAYILPVCALLAPCHAGASTPRTAHLFRDGPLPVARLIAAQRQAGAGRLRDQPASVVGHRAFGEADGLPALDDDAVGDEMRLFDGSEKVDLELQRREALALFERRGVRHAHRRVGDVAEDPAVQRAHRVGMPAVGVERELRAPCFDGHESKSNQRPDGRRRQLAGDHLSRVFEDPVHTAPGTLAHQEARRFRSPYSQVMRTCALPESISMFVSPSSFRTDSIAAASSLEKSMSRPRSRIFAATCSPARPGMREPRRMPLLTMAIGTRMLTSLSLCPSF